MKDQRRGLRDRRIVVTGGTSGIGRALVERLAAENAVVAVGRDEGELAALRGRFGRLEGRRCDLSRREEVEVLGKELAGPGAGGIDALVCNAATQSLTRLGDGDFDAEEMEAEVAVNFTSVCLLVSLLLPRMRKVETGSVIVLVNSGLAIAPKGSAPVYCATKAALRSIGQSLELELAGSGVGVAQVYLPLVDTPMTAGRGSGKLTAGVAAASIERAIEKGGGEWYVGKTRALWWLHRLAPGVARRMMGRL